MIDLDEGRTLKPYGGGRVFDRLFIEYLEWASRTVAAWPEWKQNLLGNYLPARKEKVDVN